MNKRGRIWTALSLWLLTPTYALEIYRIGGEGLPSHPDQPGITFHQLSWRELTEQSGLTAAC